MPEMITPELRHPEFPPKKHPCLQTHIFGESVAIVVQIAEHDPLGLLMSLNERRPGVLDANILLIHPKRRHFFLSPDREMTPKSRGALFLNERVGRRVTVARVHEGGAERGKGIAERRDLSRLFHRSPRTWHKSGPSALRSNFAAFFPTFGEQRHNNTQHRCCSEAAVVLNGCRGPPLDSNNFFSAPCACANLATRSLALRTTARWRLLLFHENAHWRRNIIATLRRTWKKQHVWKKEENRFIFRFESCIKDFLAISLIVVCFNRKHVRFVRLEFVPGRS